jgi:hypothetical protein
LEVDGAQSHLVSPVGAVWRNVSGCFSEKESKEKGGVRRMIYIVGWIASYLTYLLVALMGSHGTRLGRWLLIMPMLIFGAIIVFRNSGTDTQLIYEPILYDMLRGTPGPVAQGWEPGFQLVTKGLLWLTNSEVVSLRLVGVIYVGLLLVFLMRADKVEVAVLFLYYLPLFVYLHGMNTVRVGLAGVLFMLAWQALRRKRASIFWLLALSSMMFHYSMVIPILILIFSEYKLFSWKTFVAMLVIFAVLAAVVVWREDYFLTKLNLYSSFEARSPLSAVSRTALICFLSTVFAIDKVPIFVKVKTFIGLTVVTLMFQALVLVSYAGIRMVDLMTLLAPLLLIRQFDLVGRSPSKLFLWSLGFAGLIGAGFVYRNFATDFDGQVSGTPSPFLPYRTIFDEWP